MPTNLVCDGSSWGGLNAGDSDLVIAVVSAFPTK